MSVAVRIGSNFEFGVPRPLFAAPIPTMGITSDRTHYAVSPDDQRFLLRKSLEEKPPTLITVVLNWTADLKR